MGACLGSTPRDRSSGSCDPTSILNCLQFRPSLVYQTSARFVSKRICPGLSVAKSARYPPTSQVVPLESVATHGHCRGAHSGGFEAMLHVIPSLLDQMSLV